MKQILIAILITFIFPACVLKSKYIQLEKEKLIIEKRQIKLEKQLQDAKRYQQVLIDSINYLP